MKSIAIGTVVPITNKKKVTNEGSHFGGYLMIGGVIRPVAFTENDLEIITTRAFRNREDMPPIHYGRYRRWRPRKARN